MTKAPRPTKNPKKQRNNKKPQQNFDYTTAMDRPRVVSSSNNRYPTGMVISVYERSTIPLTTTVVLSKGHTFKNLKIILLIETEGQQPTKVEKS